MEKVEQYNSENEKKVREFWVKNKIANKSRTQNAKGKGFFMMDGPPYASGHIHMGTALNKIVKDITMRNKRMQGFSVLDQPGYDTHGLPIENKVEKELGFKTKADIEKFGEDKFIEKCRNYATEFIGIMNEEFDNLGIWMDWENPYLTLNKEYMESVWWTFKKADEKGLLYLGKYPIHACPRCATAVSYGEIEYTKQTDTAVYVKFKIKNEKNKYLLIWTTTPWTLPSNTGIMVNPKFDYVEAEVGGEIWILAKDLLQTLMEKIEAGFVIKKTLKGKELEGIEYENPLAKNLKLEEIKNGYRIILSERYVTLEYGTGLVHTAPGCGKEDYDEGTKAGLPIISIVDNNGILGEEGGKYAGKVARIVDAEIIKDLDEMKALVYKHPYKHDYPICWRCKTPLLNISTPQWFFKVTKIRDKLKKYNNEVDWHPVWGKDRYNDWAENLGDWPISRQRYWGVPIPMWVCDSCENQTIVGSAEELKELSGKALNDLHKPSVDKVTWKCKCKKGTMKRIPEILDVWIDSGTASWASMGYPKNKEKFEKYWPADVNIEGKDQIRLWWNTELILSTICFDEKPFKSLAMHGMVLDLGKIKMSKSQGNIVAPKEVIEKYNRDYLRVYVAKVFSGEDMLFNWDAFKEINRFFNTLWNSINYGITYLDLDLEKEINLKKLQPEDKWILSKLHSLEKEVLENYNNYNYPKVINSIEYFVLEEFSRTYIKLIRDRVKNEKSEVLSAVFSQISSALLKMLSPITPHFSEHFYQGMKSNSMQESVHLLELPKANEKFIDEELEKEVAKAKDLIQETLSLREQEKLRLRWPLEELIYVGKKKEFSNTIEIIASQANVKKFSEGKEPKGNFASKEFGEGKIFLNLDASTELKEEWELMELRRKIQDMRKQLKFNPTDKAELIIGSNDNAFVEKYKKEIEESTNTKIVSPTGKGKMEKLLEREFFIELKK
ncbi:MAG: isoleucine--tRNA ligase [archaeon]|nr:isoleucine--tRNA ligase [archaeon]